MSDKKEKLSQMLSVEPKSELDELPLDGTNVDSAQPSYPMINPSESLLQAGHYDASRSIAVEKEYSNNGENGHRGKKRRKMIKSCAFCRKRKLKCDRKRPKCTGCEMRKLPECLYTDEFNFDLTQDELFGDSPNIQLLQEIQKLKQKLKNASNLTMVTPYIKTLKPHSLQAKEENPLLKYTFISKKNGRIVRYGPTSVRVVVLSTDPRFVKTFKDILRICKEERAKRKKSGGGSMLYELQRIECPWSLGMLISQLPKYSELCASVMLAFKYKGYQIHKIFDKSVVMSYLTNCFNIRDDRIIELIPYPKLNYYPIGIVLCIYLSFLDEAPSSFVSFFLMLMGQSTAKAFYVERVQFLMLQYLWKASRSHTGGDNSHLAHLMENITSAAQDVGLHDSIDELDGDKEILKNLWNWILFYDGQISYDMGRPLMISDSIYDTEDLLKDDTSDDIFLKKLKKTVYHCRHTISNIHHRDKVPDLDLYINDMVNLLDELWPDFNEFIRSSSDINRPLDMGLALLVLPILSIITNLLSLKRLKFNDRSIANHNNFVKYSMLTIGLLVSILIRCYQMDMEQNPNCLSNTKKLPPTMRFSVSAISGHMIRQMIQLYEFLFRGATSDVSMTYEIPYELFSEPPSDKALPFLTVFKCFKNCWDQVGDQSLSSLYKVLTTRTPFVQMFVYESTTRIILHRAIQNYNEKADRRLSNSSVSTITTVITQNSESTSENAILFSLSEQPLDLVTDEFWRNYGPSFEELFDFSTDQFDDFPQYEED